MVKIEFRGVADSRDGVERQPQHEMKVWFPQLALFRPATRWRIDEDAMTQEGLAGQERHNVVTQGIVGVLWTLVMPEIDRDEKLIEQAMLSRNIGGTKGLRSN